MDQAAATKSRPLGAPNPDLGSQKMAEAGEAHVSASG